MLRRMAALYAAFDIVRRGGTVSLSGVYGGMADPLPMLTLFDKQVQLRMGRANVKRWVPDILRGGSTRSRPITCPWTRRLRRTRCSRKSRKARSRSSSTVRRSPT